MNINDDDSTAAQRDCIIELANWCCCNWCEQCLSRRPLCAQCVNTDRNWRPILSRLALFQCSSNWSCLCTNRQLRDRRKKPFQIEDQHTSIAGWNETTSSWKHVVCSLTCFADDRGVLQSRRLRGPRFLNPELQPRPGDWRLWYGSRIGCQSNGLSREFGGLNGVVWFASTGAKKDSTSGFI